MAFPLDDDEDELNFAPSGSGSISATLPGASPLSMLSTSYRGAATSPGSDKMRQIGLSLLGDPGDISKTLDNNRDMQLAAIERATQRIQGLRDQRNVNLPLLAAGAGMLQPTRSGSFAESLGHAGAAAVPALQHDRAQDDQEARELGALDLKGAEIPSNELLKRLGLSEKFMQAAETADARRSVMQRYMMPQYKIVPKVGMVRINPDGTTELVHATPDPANDPAMLARVQRMYLKEADGMEFSDAEQRQQWVQDQVELFRHGLQTYSPGQGYQRRPAAQPAASSTTTPSPSPGAPGALPQPPAAAQATPAGPPAITAGTADTADAAPAGQPDATLAASPAGKLPAQVTPPVGMPNANITGVTTPAAPQIDPIPGSYIPAITGPGVRPAVPTLRNPADEAASKAAAIARSKDEEDEAKQTMALATEAGLQRGRIQSLQAMNIKSGRLEPFKAQLGAWGKALGIPIPEGLAKAAVDVPMFNHIAMQFVLDEQLKQKGVQTEGDARRIGQTFAQIENPQEANDMILRLMKAQAQRALDKQAFYSKWRETHPDNRISGAKQAWDDYIRSTPLIMQGPNGEPVTYYEYMDAAKRANKNHPNWFGETIVRWGRHAEKTGQND